jgi:O-Antigen ligase
MPSTFAVSRSHLIFGLCLPLAVLLGYLLAAQESGSMAVVVMVLAVLCLPLLMRWHYPLLVLSWHAAIMPFFLPGHVALWFVMAVVSLGFATLNRAINPENRFLSAPTVTRPLLALLGVVLVTAMLSGGIGMSYFGTSMSGGKGYLYILVAMAGYFALTSQTIPDQRAGLYVALFFLTGITAVISNLAFIGGPKFYFLYDLFPLSMALDQARASYSLEGGLGRIAGLMFASQALFLFLLARYGIRGIFDFARPWRLALLAAAGVGCLFGAFRSTVVLIGLTFLVLFFVEGMWRTRVTLILMFLGLVGTIVVFSYSDRLPLPAQRALSFLPIKIDPVTRDSAESSVQWRLDIWKSVLPDVPKYFFKGKGYAMDPKDLQLVYESAERGYLTSEEGAVLGQDYHNGPLSVCIPFGIWGVGALGWFFVAGLRALHRNWRYGRPDLRTINTFLFAFFLTRVLFFVCIYGDLRYDLYLFTGLIGFSVALNGGVRQAPKPEPVALGEFAGAWS